jgi:SOS-response transcriptional repressor LexA
MLQYPITNRQKAAKDAIIKLTEMKGEAPTYAEVAAELGKSRGATIHLIKRLVARGHLRRLPYAARTLQIIKERPSA